MLPAPSFHLASRYRHFSVLCISVGARGSWSLSWVLVGPLRHSVVPVVLGGPRRRSVVLVGTPWSPWSPSALGGLPRSSSALLVVSVPPVGSGPRRRSVGLL